MKDSTIKLLKSEIIVKKVKTLIHCGAHKLSASDLLELMDALKAKIIIKAKLKEVVTEDIKRMEQYNLI